MQKLADTFLAGDEKQKVLQAVEAAEKETAGEIVVMIVPASYDYPMANVIGAAAFALPLSLLLTPYAGGWLWIGTQNMWLFLGIFTLLFLGFYFAVQHLVWLKRWFISRQEVEAEVEEAALTAFYQEGLYRTRDETGVLLFISVFERRVWILADRGINARVPHERWQEIVEMIVTGIREKRQADSIVAAVEKVGGILKAHFPVKPGDTDELKNLIIEDG